MYGDRYGRRGVSDLRENKEGPVSTCEVVQAEAEAPHLHCTAHISRGRDAGDCQTPRVQGETDPLCSERKRTYTVGQELVGAHETGLGWHQDGMFIAEQTD